MARRAWFCGAFLALLALSGCQERQEPQQLTLAGEVSCGADGTVVYRWKDGIIGNEFYKLADGTELLMVAPPSWPWNTYVSGMEGYHGMTEAAQGAVRDYYEEQGFLFDVDALLEDAYADYLSSSTAEDAAFISYFATQSVSPSYETERFTIFSTNVSQTVSEQARAGVAEELHISAIFDRDTGAQLSLWDLFTVPEEQIPPFLFSLHPNPEAPPLSMLEEALRPEYFEWSGDGLSIVYPAGTLDWEGYEYNSGFFFSYEDIAEIMQPWALPDQSED